MKNITKAYDTKSDMVTTDINFKQTQTFSDEIISLNTAHCNANDIAIAKGEDAQVTQAFDLKVVKTAKERTEEAESKKPE